MTQQSVRHSMYEAAENDVCHYAPLVKQQDVLFILNLYNSLLF